MSRHIFIFKPSLLTDHPLTLPFLPQAKIFTLAKHSSNSHVFVFSSPVFPVLLQILTVELGIKDLGSLKQTKTMYHAIEGRLQRISPEQEDHLYFSSASRDLPHLLGIFVDRCFRLRLKAQVLTWEHFNHLIGKSLQVIGRVLFVVVCQLGPYHLLHECCVSNHLSRGDP